MLILIFFFLQNLYMIQLSVILSFNIYLDSLQSFMAMVKSIMSNKSSLNILYSIGCHHRILWDPTESVCWCRRPRINSLCWPLPLEGAQIKLTLEHYKFHFKLLRLQFTHFVMNILKFELL